MGHDTTAEPRAGTTTADMQRWIKNANHAAQWIATIRRGLPGPVRGFLAVDVPEMMRAIGRQAVELARLRDGDDAPLPRNAGPFGPNTRVTFGPDREPGTITAVVMRRAMLEHEESGAVVVEPGARVWEYDVRADSNKRLVACQPRDVELLPIDLAAAAATLANCLDGDGAAAALIAEQALAELAYRLTEIEVLRGDVERLRAAVITCDDEPGGGQ